MPRRGQWQSRHAKYTADTRYIADTLTKVAKQYGFFSRKSTYDLPSPAKGYQLEMSEFIPLAEHIEKHGSNVSHLPPMFFERLSQCIDRRKSVHAQHVIKSHSLAAKASDKRHEHFNNAMEKVRCRLRRQEALAKTGKVASQAQQMQPESEPLQINEELQLRPLPSNLEERLMALTCLMDDFTDIQIHVIQLWSRYKEKELDLVTVSLATDLALCVAKEFEDEIVQDFGGRDEIEALFGRLWFLHCQEHNVDPTISPADQKLPEKMYDILHYLLYGIRSMLKSYLQVQTSGQIIAYKQDYYGIYEKFGLYTDLPASQKFHVDKLTLMEALPHFELLLRAGDSSPWPDCITAGVMDVLQNGQITITSTLAIRLYLAIRHELRSDLNRASQELSITTNLLISSVEQFLSHQNQHPDENWLSRGLNMCGDLLQRLGESARPSQVTNEILAQHSDSTLTASLVGWPHFLLEHHPLGCGVRLCQARVDFLRAGVACANSGGAVMSCAHLYHALCEGGHVREAWTDMEFLLEIHNRGLFNGEVPSNPKECQIQYALLVKTLSQSGSIPVSAHSAEGRLGTLAVSTMQLIGESYGNSYGKGEYSLSKTAQGHSSEHITELSFSEQLRSKLNNLCASIVQERPHFHVDYFQLHKSCWMVLRMVKLSMRTTLTERYPDIWTDEKHLPLISLLVLRQLATLDSPGRTGMEADKIVHAAADALQAVTNYQVPQENCLFGEITRQKMIRSLEGHAYLQHSS